MKMEDILKYTLTAIAVPSLIAIFTKTGQSLVINCVKRLSRGLALFIFGFVLSGCTGIVLTKNDGVVKYLINDKLNKLDYKFIKNQIILKDFTKKSDVFLAVDNLRQELDGVDLVQFNLSKNKINYRDVIYWWTNQNLGSTLNDKKIKFSIENNFINKEITSELLKAIKGQGYKKEVDTKTLRKEKHYTTRAKLLVSKWFNTQSKNLASIDRRGYTDSYFIVMRSSDNRYFGWITLKSVDVDKIRTKKKYKTIEIVLDNFYEDITKIIDKEIKELNIKNIKKQF